MAFQTKQVPDGNRFSMTPSMLLVEKGQEYKLSTGRKLWNRNGTIAQAYKSLLNHFGSHLLKPSAKEGKGSADLKRRKSGFVWFLYPQVTGNSKNIHCTACHMPAHEGFKQAFPTDRCPYNIDHRPDQHCYYTRVNLGNDKHGKVVWERVHAILAAAKWGIPDAVFDPKLGDKDTPQALHTPTCPGYAGGCLNPLHIDWKVTANNRKDQETKRTQMNRGPRAHGNKHVFNTEVDD